MAMMHLILQIPFQLIQRLNILCQAYNYSVYIYCSFDRMTKQTLACVCYLQARNNFVLVSSTPIENEKKQSFLSMYTPKQESCFLRNEEAHGAEKWALNN